ncbi:hypothetical protein DID96_35575 [Burkholderia sp. Bp8963]|nr:hypothetical protein DID96_35575 [Burkholderia sp. Bp8963]
MARRASQRATHGTSRNAHAGSVNPLEADHVLRALAVAVRDIDDCGSNAVNASSSNATITAAAWPPA